MLGLGAVGPDKLRAEWSLPGFVSMFLPEFPHRTVPGHEHFQVGSSSWLAPEALLDIKLYWGTGPYSCPFFFFQACCAQCTTRL